MVHKVCQVRAGTIEYTKFAQKGPDMIFVLVPGLNTCDLKLCFAGPEDPSSGVQVSPNSCSLICRRSISSLRTCKMHYQCKYNVHHGHVCLNVEC